MQAMTRPIVQVTRREFDPKKLQKAMEAAGWDAQATATASRVNAETVKGWLIGKSAPKGALLLQLSEALGIDPFDLFVPTK